MFSFHRPKVYRSSTGCCICKAKSSSSRFTDSKKYEEDFLECFQLATPRQGEICNACVLLVKRWKKLPAGSDRNWRHVVDARAGPGIKSMTKVKSKNKRLTDNNNEEKIIKKKKHFDREYSPSLSDKSDGSPDTEMADVEFFAESGPSRLSSRAASPTASDCEDNFGHSRRHKSLAKRRENTPEISGFIDLEYWKQENVCCGIVFRGPNKELLVDTRFLKPCNARLASIKHRLNSVKVEGEIPDTSVMPKNYSDNSSDSGYDECSNPGAADNNAFKKDAQQVSISHLNNQLQNSNGN